MDQTPERKFTTVHKVAGISVLVVGLVGGFEVLCQLEGGRMTASAANEQPRSLMAEGAACLLPSDELAKRLALYERDVFPRVSSVTRGDDVMHLVMKGTPAAARTIADRMAALEAGCCSFMTIRYADDIAPTAIEIQASDTFLDQLVSWGLPTTDDGPVG